MVNQSQQGTLQRNGRWFVSVSLTMQQVQIGVLAVPFFFKETPKGTIDSEQDGFPFAFQVGFPYSATDPLAHSESEVLTCPLALSFEPHHSSHLTDIHLPFLAKTHWLFFQGSLF